MYISLIEIHLNILIMSFLVVIIIAGLIWYALKVGFNIGSLIGGIIGAMIGSSVGIAGGGGATSGTIIFGAIGFVVGGLISKGKHK